MSKKSTDELIEDLAIITKQGFDALRSEINERFQAAEIKIDDRFDQMENRLDRIENISLGGHENRISNLEDGMRVVKTKLEIR